MFYRHPSPLILVLTCLFSVFIFVLDPTGSVQVRTSIHPPHPHTPTRRSRRVREGYFFPTLSFVVRRRRTSPQRPRTLKYPSFRHSPSPSISPSRHLAHLSISLSVSPSPSHLHLHPHSSSSFVTTRYALSFVFFPYPPMLPIVICLQFALISSASASLHDPRHESDSGLCLVSSHLSVSL
ncbi:hypothetical protein BDZ97DRAFT_210963 [Flammula alnicola]|nr:hypothetical protein BDZ97DRAFT_210963 [Flammula alnicola]